MATRTLSSGDCIRPYRRVRVEELKEGASQTFKMGDPLIRSSVSGYEGDHVVIAGADAVALIYGFAAQDATGVTGSKICVWVADGEAEFRGAETNGAGSPPYDGTLDGTHVGLECGLLADSTNKIWRVDYSEVTAKSIRIIKLLDADGDVNGYVVFKVKGVTTATQAIYGGAA